MVSRPVVWLFGWLLSAAVFCAGGAEASRVLLAFGPGGPHQVMAACAEAYRQRSGVTIRVLNAKPEELPKMLRTYGDLYFGGAEYMMEDLARTHPDLLDLATVENLHPRRVGVVVRKGNPLNIRGVDDLAGEEVDLLDVKLENMEPFHPLEADGRQWNRIQVHTGKQGVAAWRDRPQLDAWVTYKSWHELLGDETEFVEIEGPQALRYTPVALTQRTPHPEEAQGFIDFLKSAEAREIFLSHGWD